MKKISLIIILFSTLCFGATVDTLAIPSVVMNKTLKAAVVLPNSYIRTKMAYPVVYLLHGAGGNFSDWLKKTPNQTLVKELADQYNMIIVLPAGEAYSFYIDSPTDKSSQFETYITREVVAKIDASYRTISDKKGRAISGYSMGGHGALYLSTRHPELYCAAGSMSGTVDMSILPGGSKGSQADSGTSREANAAVSVLNMIAAMKSNKLALIIDCGVSDFLIESNRELHRRMVYYQVPHDYTERPGAHNWEYWQNSVQSHLLFFSQVFKSNGVTVMP